MMKLSSMENVVNTVDQDWRSLLAETILPLQAVDIPESPEYPKWLKDLRQKLGLKLAAYRSGFDLY
jgi:hypothetical protein